MFACSRGQPAWTCSNINFSIFLPSGTTTTAATDVSQQQQTNHVALSAEVNTIPHREEMEARSFEAKSIFRIHFNQAGPCNLAYSRSSHARAALYLSLILVRPQKPPPPPPPPATWPNYTLCVNVADVPVTIAMEIGVNTGATGQRLPVCGLASNQFNRPARADARSLVLIIARAQSGAHALLRVLCVHVV